MPTSKEQRSLFGEILDWMLAPLLLLWPMSVLLTWLVAQNIANRPFDRQLDETARALARQAHQADHQLLQLALRLVRQGQVELVAAVTAQRTDRIAS